MTDPTPKVKQGRTVIFRAHEQDGDRHSEFVSFRFQETDLGVSITTPETEPSREEVLDEFLARLYRLPGFDVAADISRPFGAGVAAAARPLPTPTVTPAPKITPAQDLALDDLILQGAIAFGGGISDDTQALIKQRVIDQMDRPHTFRLPVAVSVPTVPTPLPPVTRRKGHGKRTTRRERRLNREKKG